MSTVVSPDSPATPTTASSAPLSPISFLLRSARVWRDVVAVRDGDLTLTYAELLQRVERTAGALRERGVEPGDRQEEDGPKQC